MGVGCSRPAVHVNRQGENVIRFRIEWLFVVTLALGLFAAPFAAEAQPPIRIGASLSQTGAYAATSSPCFAATSSASST